MDVASTIFSPMSRKKKGLFILFYFHFVFISEERRFI